MGDMKTGESFHYVDKQQAIASGTPRKYQAFITAYFTLKASMLKQEPEASQYDGL
ncbi:MAG: hypothetical protein KME27_22480 [Lyngbya sp. HA4199-MV5]|jgi:hypothetical protein|nr:hypothetical protein [Lyngbya sp. HA4199-MV5]